jgi:hypothetical protein
LFIFFIFVNTISAQKSDFAIGGGIGAGGFIGNFPTQTTLGTKLYFEAKSPINIFNSIQFHLTAAQKIEKFLPDSYTYDHYSYFTSIGISGIFNQPLNEYLNIQEGVGLIYLNDRSFSDIDSWNFGVLLNLGIGTPISNSVDLSINIDYGITVNNTNASYYLFIVEGKFYL